MENTTMPTTSHERVYFVNLCGGWQALYKNANKKTGLTWHHARYVAYSLATEAEAVAACEAEMKKSGKTGRIVKGFPQNGIPANF